MKGVVSKIRKNGFLEVQADSLVSVVELIGCSIVNIGDEVEGGLDVVGGKVLTNVSQKDSFDAYVQEVI